MLSSQTESNVTVRSKLPDRSWIARLAVPVQSESTVYVPENSSWAMAPFRLEVALPFVTFPAASNVIVPSETLGPTPMTVPFVLNPYVPAARASEHAAARTCAVAAILYANMATIVVSKLPANLRSMGVLLSPRGALPHWLGPSRVEEVNLRCGFGEEGRYLLAHSVDNGVIILPLSPVGGKS